MQAYVGIDVHRRRSQIAVMDGAGKVAVNRNVPNGRDTVLGVIGDPPSGTPVAFEASYGLGWLIELLRDYGFEPHLAHPLHCKGIASARLKNDKVDAAALAHLLCADLLPEAWIAPQHVREQRAVLRHRTQLVRLRTLIRNRIHAILADHGCDRSSTCWSAPERRWLDQLPLPAVCRMVVANMLKTIDALHAVIDRVDVHLAETAKADPRGEGPHHAPPGVDRLTAMTIITEVGDVTRFPSARKLASWAGLTPTVRGSDRTVRHRHISKQGNPWLRRIMNEAAQTAKRSPLYAAHYEQIAHRRGKKIATIAIAPQAPHPRLPPAARGRSRTARHGVGLSGMTFRPRWVNEQPGPRSKVMIPPDGRDRIGAWSLAPHDRTPGGPRRWTRPVSTSSPTNTATNASSRDDARLDHPGPHGCTIHLGGDIEVERTINRLKHSRTVALQAYIRLPRHGGRGLAPPLAQAVIIRCQRRRRLSSRTGVHQQRDHALVGRKWGRSSIASEGMNTGRVSKWSPARCSSITTPRVSEPGTPAFM
ncbi:IS110 family transposase [Streptomyces sp. NPDC001795]|uniref:IS110 family transposase n=1 Tax=Streptomyces sp. NPDC001795 TaxID=3154525 RepID=UPI0033166485